MTLLGDQQVLARQILRALMAPAAHLPACRCVRRLMQLGVPFDLPGMYEPLIHRAAGIGDRELLHALLTAGENVDRTNCEELSGIPLHLAVLDHDVTMTQELLAAGADVSLRVRADLPVAISHGMEDGELHDSWAALDFAALEGRVGLLSLLVGKGADMNAWALHTAAIGNQVGAIDTQVELGADLEGEPGHLDGKKPVEVAGGSKRCGRRDGLREARRRPQRLLRHPPSPRSKRGLGPGDSTCSASSEVRSIRRRQGR